MSDEKKPAATDPSKRRRRRRRKPAAEGSQAESAAGASHGPRETTTEQRRPERGPAVGGAGKANKRRRRRKTGTERPGPKPEDSAGHRRPPEDANERGRRGPKERTRDGGKERGREQRQETTAAQRDAQHPIAARPIAARPAELARPAQTDPDEGTEDTAPAGDQLRWGDDSEAPTPEIASLKADLPANAPTGDWDPSTAHLLNEEGYEGALSARICNVIGVRFVPAGRLYLYDGGEGQYHSGDRVLVESERGERIGTVGAASTRRPPPRSLKRILRRATEDESQAEPSTAETGEYLQQAKALAKEFKLGIKVFRASMEGDKKIGIYYSCDDKTDVRRLSRALSDALPYRVELRHHGVRDEAKLVGGIGSCGQELCCTTWLPAFVPVSIKNAKDQGLVLNPTKVSGQCGRLKCCLVYEQAQYAEMRKGLPKLGKRVITQDGLEGRVVEVDVLHQRIRVSVGRGESKMYGKGEVEPMFASQPQGSAKKNKSRPAADEGSTEAQPADRANTSEPKESNNEQN